MMFFFISYIFWGGLFYSCCVLFYSLRTFLPIHQSSTSTASLAEKVVVLSACSTWPLLLLHAIHAVSMLLSPCCLHAVLVLHGAAGRSVGQATSSRLVFMCDPLSLRLQLTHT